MSISRDSTFATASSVADAVRMRAQHDRPCEFFAGATWVMRASLREEKTSAHYISIANIDELKRVELTEKHLSIGAAVTHAQIANAVAGIGHLRGLYIAASKSANPNIRNVASVGGNLCAANFPAADLLPALIALRAEIELMWDGVRERMTLEDFVHTRKRGTNGGLLTEVIVPLSDRRSAHTRLPLRKAGDYPAAIVSAVVSVAADGRIGEATIAVGSVEDQPRRWIGLEQALKGQPCSAEGAAKFASLHISEFVGRDGVDVPGWYRTQVLPTLVRRAFTQIELADR